jgi:hypothetical protein
LDRRLKPGAAIVAAGLLLLVSVATSGHGAQMRRTEPSRPSPTLLADAATPAGLTGLSALVAALYEKPFAADGTWNRQLDSAARTQAVPGLDQLPVGISSWLRPDGVSIPVFQARASDEVTQLLFNPLSWTMLANETWKPADNAPETEAAIRASSRAAFPLPYHPYVSQSVNGFALAEGYNPIRNPPGGAPFTFRAPAGLRSSGNADGHMVVFQPDGSVIETYATIVLSDNTVVCLTYMVTDAAKAGDGLQNGVTAAMIPVYAGLIRRGELAAGRIDHAMKVVMPAGMLAPAYTYPAYAFDRGAMTERPPYSGTLPMGARLAIPASVDLAQLKLQTRTGTVLAEAAQRYGFVVTDRGGPGITLVMEADMSAAHAWNSEVEEDLRSIFRKAERVLTP